MLKKSNGQTCQCTLSALCWQLEDTSCCALRARDAREAQLVAAVVEAIAGVVVVVMGIVEGVVVTTQGDTLTDDKGSLLSVTGCKAGAE